MDTVKDKPTYKIADIFMFRTPLLSLKVLEEVSDQNDLNAFLKKYFADQKIREALFLASPYLCKRSKGSDYDEKLKYSLLKYLIRMSSRCTPFGLFAGIGSGHFGDKDKFKTTLTETFELHCRPDMQLICSLAENLLQERRLRERLLYYPNTSLSLLGDAFRYIEYATDLQGLRRYKLQSVSYTPLIEDLIRSARAGANFSFLANSIIDNDIEKADAEAFVHLLIDNQLLVSELEPRITGEDFFTILLKKVKSYEIRNEKIHLLETIEDHMLKLKGENNIDRLPVFESISSKVKDAGLPFHENSLIQADMKVCGENVQLSGMIREDIQDALPGIMKLSRYQKSPLLEAFKLAFLRRYENSEVPLLLALDAEAGPAYLPDETGTGASALLEGIVLPPKKSDTSEINWGPVDRMLYHKLQDALIGNLDQIELKDEDLTNIPTLEQELPFSIYALTRIHGKYKKDPLKRWIQLDTIGGSSAGNLAGRFCYLDSDIENTIKEIAQAEQDMHKEALLAEIVHLPQQRTGNVLMRPVLRKYEMAYLAAPGVEDEFAIPISDLMLSVRNDKVLLRSVKHDKYIIPRLSNAHNYSMGSLAVYHFLCDLQTQDIRSNLSFNWGPIEADTIFLPRIVYKNIILQRASWNFTSEHLLEIVRTKEEELISAMALWRLKYRMPREIVLAMADNELWIDLENLHCLKLLQTEIRNNQRVTFHEFIIDKKEAVISGNEGAHANEFVFFMQQKK